jgi:DNA-directed RNA polymerase specialized sigma24 family protein
LDQDVYTEAPLVTDGSSVREALLRMVHRLTSNQTLRDDLLQEASVHIWLTEMRRPGQTSSWYLQSCKFHLQHYLASGRSVDSFKRGSSQIDQATDTEEGEALEELRDSGDTVFTWVSAREIMELLSPHLSDTERAVLECLSEGLGPREIGRELSMSHTMVIKHRRRIASVLVRFEMSPPKAVGQEANGRP